MFKSDLAFDAEAFAQQACRESNGTIRHVRRNKYRTYIQVVTLRKEEFSNSKYHSMFTEGVYVESYPP